MKIHFSLKSKWVKAVGIIITAASFVFLGKSLLSMHVDFSKLHHPAWMALLLAVLAVCYVGVVYLSAAAWRLVLNFISRTKIPFHNINDVYVRANIAKYLPSGVMHFAGRNVLAKKLNFDQIDVAFSTILEVVTLLVTAVLWSVVLSYHAFVSVILKMAGRSSIYLIIAAVVVVAALAVVATVFLRRRGLLEKYKRFLTPAFARMLPQLFGFYSLTMMIPGLLLAAILGLLGVALTPAHIITIIVAYMISWVAGYVVIGSPGGLGVRESVMVLLLAGAGLGALCSSDIALLAALLLRVTSAVGDALAYGLQLWLIRRRRRRLGDMPDD